MRNGTNLEYSQFLKLLYQYFGTEQNSYSPS